MSIINTKNGTIIAMQDFCYYANTIFLVMLLFYPNNEKLFMGPLAWALIVWRCILAFSSVDKLVRVLVHLLPGVKMKLLGLIQLPTFPADAILLVILARNSRRVNMACCHSMMTDDRSLHHCCQLALYINVHLYTNTCMHLNMHQDFAALWYLKVLL